jgi:hypothetical protein
MTTGGSVVLTAGVTGEFPGVSVGDEVHAVPRMSTMTRSIALNKNERDFIAHLLVNKIR